MNAQFEYINEKAKTFQSDGQPVISVDSKKKEVVGNFKNSGKEYRPKGNTEGVLFMIFRSKSWGKQIHMASMISRPMLAG